MDLSVSELSIPSEKLGELYGPMYKYYPRQWVRLIGNGAKEVDSTVQLDFDVLCSEWNTCVETKNVSRKLANMLMYIYCAWIKKFSWDIKGSHAELTHDQITLMMSRFYSVPLNNPSRQNPVQSIFNLMNRIKKQAWWKLNKTSDKNKLYQLKYNNKMLETSYRHELMVDDEGEPNYRMNKYDWDWDWGERLDDED